MSTIVNRTEDNFTKFVKLIDKQFQMMAAHNLYEVEIDKELLWNTYLDSFPEGTNEIYRERREYDCNTCKQFIRRVGNVVSIIDGKFVSIWDVAPEDSTFSIVTKALSNFVHKHKATNVFYTDMAVAGCECNYETTEECINKYEHFYTEIPKKYVKGKDAIPVLKAEVRDKKSVLKRGLDEFTKEALDTVKDMIDQNWLYRGEEWKAVLKEFTELHEKYHLLGTEEDKEIFAWEKAATVSVAVAKLRNHSFGTLITDISTGTELETAVKAYERMVAPANYKRPKAIFTKKMLEEAQKTITELGYMDSLERRFAKLDDITVNNILFSNKDSAKRIHGAMDLFAAMEKDVTINPKRFDKVEEIDIEDFIKNILPTATEVEAYVENRHERNMCSLIAPVNKDSKTMFKWNNNFGWAYTGNITDSMKERVKAAGGKIDGDLRFSIQWNEDGTDNCDLDAHCTEAGGREIYYGSYVKPRFSPTGGQLDVDIVTPGGQIAVENITWADRETMTPGTYKFYVHQFSGRAKNGFRAEIEFNGEIHSFDYSQSMRTDEKVCVAEVTLDLKGNFTIKELLPSTTTSKDIWGIKTNQFTPVSVICYSPNWWDEQTGNKHYMFMLKDCVNPEEPNGFYNEFLNSELLQHKRVLEALGSKAHVQDTEDQLSGLGFSSTQRNELVVKVKGANEGVMKIKF